jgi:hypothetical protein
MSAPESHASGLLGGESFSFADAIGGWRGLIESALPGIVYVVVFLIADTWLAPTIAALVVVAVLVALRLIQRGSITQSLSGVVGVAIGAVWAWRTGSASGYFAPGLWANAAYLVGILISMAVRWPAAGVVMGFVHGTGTHWREAPGHMRRAQLGSAVLAGMFALRLAVQVPLFLADQTAVLGTVKLVMGTPLFALTLWVVWLIVRNVGRRQEQPDQHPQT